ncbi:MAG TPA: trehalase family glycosidase [Candidatus Angelobacter sp.]|jgi:alpha,alpha-trehalase|nr:trehalase family glycosidase [Candidatus Angelobacter sp.]
MKLFKKLLLSAFLLASSSGSQIPVRASQQVPAEGLRAIQSYISSAWDRLTRSMTRCDSVVDPKISAPSVLYLPDGFPAPPSVEQLQRDCKVEVKHLPAVINHPGEIDPEKVQPAGLLFLENNYVVPGGRFNEMYGWDSYFIILGLLRDGRVDLARGMVGNFLFEIEHYGTVLNANRTYYLTRSQPPFLTSMILAVYDQRPDIAWLAHAYSAAQKDYQMWTRAPHLAGNTGLSRYYDFGNGPVPEGLKDESGYYRKVAAYFLEHPHTTPEFVESHDGKTSSELNEAVDGPVFRLQLCEALPSGEKCEPLKKLSLSRDFYKGDRAMRESGFDISFRFGPYGAQTHRYAPVCLNSLLYKTEKDLEHISVLLGKSQEAAKWRKRAQLRKQRVDRFLWDGKRGLFFDYDFEAQKHSRYEYATTLYPLWAGLANREQAQAVQKNLGVFEQAGGLTMSHTESGVQWDFPYGWAPIQLLGVKGLRRYGFSADADRISYKFLSMVMENFQRDGTIREKYNVATRSSETNVASGYQSNEIGFGWTNGVFLELLHDLPAESSKR